MTKYEIGDKFVAEITDIDENGMGVAYTLNDFYLCNETTLNHFELMEIAPLSREEEKPQAEKVTYTPEDLISRIKRANDILSNLITAYVEMTNTINHIPDIDDRLEELSL